MTEQRNILTIATGKKVFVDMAINLAYSFLHWHPGSTVRFFLVTDLPHYIPETLSKRIEIQIVQAGSLGKGFSSKLF